MLLDSGFLEFKLDYAKTKDLAVGDSVHSKNFLAGGHVWRIKCYPRGLNKEYRGEYLSIYLELVSHGRDVKAIFDVFMAERDGAPSPDHHRRCVHVYPPDRFTIWGWSHFVERREIEEDGHHLIDHDDGSVTFVCGVVVVRPDRDASMPPADVATHLGELLRGGEGSEVSFSVGGETFAAHRAVLAVHVCFPGMRCPRTGNGPRAVADGDHGHATSLSWAQKLSDDVSLDSVTAILCCAELHECPELRSRCLDFFTEEDNFQKLALTEEYTCSSARASLHG
ncbi:hypothetical protein PR202_gb02624 [Eleusine coracana subsp. coracana]|uniref:MATH domain-containing protein n=1 Tax=Eleusine coracana subsp. coracana TaxID=191504 RepID=A0AAV5DXF7_ELECO|nr:hypothetical protein PR202_gb02624 [Eleusine coracana subsp. coracana]